mgnify:CR=1 FL=1
MPRLAADERRQVDFQIVGDAFASAVAELAPGATLDGTALLRDQFDRVLPLAVHAVPASPDAVRLTLLSPEEQFSQVGAAVTLGVEVRVESLPMAGVTTRLTLPEGIEVIVPAAPTLENGHTTFVVRAVAPGDYSVSIAVPAFPDAAPATAVIHVTAADPCAVDARGRNACGDADFWSCESSGDGVFSCTDIDECTVDRQGQNGCGAASRWLCTNAEGAAPACDDVDECARDNGGCGPPDHVRCNNLEGAAPRCEDINECAVENGGCGDPAHARCLDQLGAAPVCEDINECVPDDLGQTFCGDGRYTRCENRDRVPPLCADANECLLNNGGCGPPRYTSCLNQEGAPPLCEDVDECARDEEGRNYCGVADRWVCTNLPGAEPVCRDIQECAVENGGCGDPSFVRCVERQGAEPACEDVRECAPDDNGHNACGDGRYWRCEERFGEAPLCDDIDECEIDQRGFTACGDADRWTCTNLRGRSPICEDIDECVVRNGQNACGDADRWTCQNREDLPPVCTDIDECAENNGGCGDPDLWSCENQPGQAPNCQDRDECEPDQDGINSCGDARFWECFDRVGLPPTCRDLDECEEDDDGQNACGDARYWVCADNEGAPPDCEDTDECAVLNGGCGDATYTRCVDTLGGPARCVDIDECAQGNGGCGDVRFIRCVNRLGLPPTCEDRDLCAADLDGNNACGVAVRWQCADTDGGPAQCVDIDECESIDGANECGVARGYLCINEAGAAPTCQACALGTTNLDLDLQNGCEYACGPPSSEQCNAVDDNCDGRVDEGFDFRTSAAHCGGCGQVCDERPGADSVVCRGGACLVDRCAVGFRDDNGDGEDGCEAAWEPNTLFVDQFNAEPEPDGSADNPFPTIQHALDVAQPGTTIQVAEGVYDGRLVLDVADLVVQGDDMDRVIITSSVDTAPVVDVQANNVTLSGFTTVGGLIGVRFLGASQDTRLFRGRAQRVRVSDIAAPEAGSNQTGRTAVGFHLLYADRVAITACEVSRIYGGEGGREPFERAPGQAGGRGLGIWVQSSAGVLLEGNLVNDVRGGLGGRPRNISRGGYGGSASGVLVDAASNTTVQGNTVSAVLGGTGGASGTNSGNGGPGGGSRGILLTGAAATVLEGNRVTTIEGGEGGGLVGVHAATGGNGATAEGLLITNSATTAIDGLEVRNVAGGLAGSGDSAIRDGNGGVGYGIRVQTSTGVGLQHLGVSLILGGTGRNNGRSAGVQFQDASQTSLSFASIYDVGLGASPGEGIWIHADQIGQVVVRDTIVQRVERFCALNDAAPDALALSHVDLWDCTGGTHVNALVAGPILELDPGFIAPELGDLHLSPTSPLIDAGDPDSPYSLEPAQNGCRANLGAFGNTPQATSATDDGVEHCQ